MNNAENAAFFPVDRLELPPYVPRNSELDRTSEMLRLCPRQRKASFLWKDPKGRSSRPRSGRFGWAGSSAVEHVTFNHVVEGSIPSRLTNLKWINQFVFPAGGFATAHRPCLTA